ncbi:Serine/threonine protein kinase [Parafrankia irregularis]|uniref:Serine/threonine protein kinase n=1 Tax=Parafrankia irregularis TaxID=795642 RepID=A0A0S4QQD4_9ACTN|nr:DUF4352 domain-containing protein [Parafrankia irregularis]CUU57693.1 Serine/threonine protein kinase [Parafrankia irregularis]
MDHNGEHAPAARGQPEGLTPPGETLHPHEPRVIGPYRLLRRLGAGGMGTVYLSETAGRRVAVKIVRPDLAADEEFRRRFRQEVDAARRVAPFCTAEVLDADPDAAAPYLVTEFIDGVRLDHAVENGPISGSTLTGLAVGVATALTAIHSAGLVHRDLKPSNVLLSMSGPRVIDFGIAQALEGAKAKPTAWGFGSAGWMAPEQVNGQPIGPEADVFTWGILVAFAGTGRHPFGTGTDLELSTRIVGREPDLVGLSPSLKPLVAAALAKNPDARPSARDLLLSLIALPPTQPSESGEDRAWRPSPTAVDEAEELLHLTQGVSLPNVSLRRAEPAESIDRRIGVGPGAPPPPPPPRGRGDRWRAARPGRWQPPVARPPSQLGPHGRPSGAAAGAARPNAGAAPAGPPQPGGLPVPVPAGAPSFSGAAGAGQPAGGWPAARSPGGGPHHPPGLDAFPDQSRPPRFTPQRILGFAAVALVVVLAAWFISSITGADSDGGANDLRSGDRSESAQAPTAPRTAKVGSPVRDDQLEFRANKIKCGEHQIGESFLARRATGQFCLVDITVTNRGTTARLLESSKQYLTTSAGERHSADFVARFYPSLNGGIWDTIKPGDTVTGTFVFDIPADEKAKSLELHERPESLGVVITP